MKYYVERRRLVNDDKFVQVECFPVITASSNKEAKQIATSLYGGYDSFRPLKRKTKPEDGGVIYLNW